MDQFISQLKSTFVPEKSADTNFVICTFCDVAKRCVIANVAGWFAADRKRSFSTLRQNCRLSAWFPSMSSCNILGSSSFRLEYLIVYILFGMREPCVNKLAKNQSSSKQPTDARRKGRYLVCQIRIGFINICSEQYLF